MQKELLREYALLEDNFRMLEEKKSALRMLILEDLKKNKLEKVDSDYGSFTVAHKSTWRYTKAVSNLEDKVKIAKDKEQKKGLAELVTTDYLLFKKPKDE